MNRYIGSDEDNILCDNCINYYMSIDLCNEECRVRMDDYHKDRMNGLELHCNDFKRIK